MEGIRDFAVRFFLCIALSPIAGLLWMRAEYLGHGINPLDRWYVLCVYLGIGAVAGAIVGTVWGLDSLLSPPAVKPPATTSDAGHHSE
jgi:hypothetical protein